MVIEEIISERLVKHYSDCNLMLKQVETGIEYAEAIDVIPCKYSYEETDKLIVENNPNAAEELADAVRALNLLGVK